MVSLSFHVIAHWATTSLECSLSQRSLVHRDRARWEQLIYVYLCGGGF